MTTPPPPPMLAAGVDSLAELAVLTRTGVVESRHYGSLIALDAFGVPAVELGRVDATILPRSTVKPVQALACLTAGAPLAGAELAIAAGSHTGEDEHVRVVRSILARAGLGDDALQCPPDRPEHGDTFAALAADGCPRARVRMNCSGKHAAMLLACVVNGWPTESYLAPGHPLQQRVRALLAELTGESVRHDTIDGCGAPLFGTTVRGLATAFRAFVRARTESPMGRIATAMRTFPFYVGGSGHANTRTMESVPGTLAKGGAEGVIAIATDDGAVAAMKIIDGNPRATTMVALGVLAALGADVSDADELTHVDVLGGGVPVGEFVLGDDVARAVATLAERV